MKNDINDIKKEVLEIKEEIIEDIKTIWIANFILTTDLKRGNITSFLSSDTKNILHWKHLTVINNFYKMIHWHDNPVIYKLMKKLWIK